jgi:hypothetical protein
MADTISIDIEWENSKYVKITSKKNAEPKKTIIHMDENEHLVSSWLDITKICYNYLAMIMGIVGEEMAK